MATKKTTGRGSMTLSEAGQKGGREVQRQRRLRDEKQVRGDAYDKPGPAKGHAFGIAAVTQALEGLDFPASKDEVLAAAGNKKIEYRKGQRVDLRQIIEDIDDDDFASMANIVEAVSDALREEGVSSTSEWEQPGANP